MTDIFDCTRCEDTGAVRVHDETGGWYPGDCPDCFMPDGSDDDYADGSAHEDRMEAAHEAMVYGEVY